jgi:YidC/Oxa1 family membrane protein insertase
LGLADVWGAILNGLGHALSAIFEVVPSYIFAIVLLTIAVRIVLIPLTVRQIRSMAAMQKIQPKLKEIQQKYKGNRPKMNEEVMKLYREHNVNPLGGCFPLLMQAPVFIALYSVLRAFVPIDVAVVPTKVTIPITRATFCTPANAPRVDGPNPKRIHCETGSRSQDFTISGGFRDAHPPHKAIPNASYLTQCVLTGVRSGQEVRQFVCRSPIGTGHLPKDGQLFSDIVRDKTAIGGMHLACSPTQASSKTTIRQCAPRSEDAGGGALVGYYLLVAAMVGTTYYQQRQMAQRATGPQAKQMQMMGRIMPVFLGFISLSIPAGVIVYWIVSNLWTIGQQTVFFKRGLIGGPQAPAPGKPDKKGKGR